MIVEPTVSPLSSYRTSSPRSGISDHHEGIRHSRSIKLIKCYSGENLLWVLKFSGCHNRPSGGNRDRDFVVTEVIIKLSVAQIRLSRPTVEVIEHSHLRKPVCD